jgi:hypothetical protein
MEKNSFIALQNALEDQFNAQWLGESRVEQQVQALNVFGQMAELFIPMAAGAAVTMTTGASVEAKAPVQHLNQAGMPDFAWRYKAASSQPNHADHPRDRFKPFLPF